MRLNLKSAIVFYCEPSVLLEILLSLKHLWVLFISMNIQHRTFPAAILLAMDLLNNHQALEGLDFGGLGGKLKPPTSEKETKNNTQGWCETSDKAKRTSFLRNWGRNSWSQVSIIVWLQVMTIVRAVFINFCQDWIQHLVSASWVTDAPGAREGVDPHQAKDFTQHFEGGAKSESGKDCKESVTEPIFFPVFTFFLL